MECEKLLATFAECMKTKPPCYTKKGVQCLKTKIDLGICMDKYPPYSLKLNYEKAEPN